MLSAYARQGWSASLTQRGADGGADIILEGHGQKILVQCKQWKMRQIGPPTIRELHSVMVTENASSGIVVTCGTFSRRKLRVVLTPRPPLACAFTPCLAAVSGYLRRVSGMAAPMSSQAWRCSLVGSARTGTVAGVPAKRSSLRVRVPR